MSSSGGGPTPPYGGPEPGDEPPRSPYPPYGSGQPTPPYQPYGGAPNAYEGGTYGTSSRNTDGLSLAGFVTSLTCCLSPVGFVLGLIGLSRTRNNERGGRWAAIAAVLIGAVGSIALVGVIGFFVWFGTNTVYPDNADVGQCVDVDRDGVADAVLWEKDCEESHDAEIVAVDTFTAEQADGYDSLFAAEVCTEVLPADYEEVFSEEDHHLGIVIDADTDAPEPGDAFLCYIELQGGDKLDAPLVG